MQLSARILTALAVLAFAVAIVAGARSASEEVSAATGMIDALNVGACTSTNADVFKLDHCSQKMAYFQQGTISAIVETGSLYATYAHDPKTAAEAPRGIITDGDLIRISVTDKGRDRRDPVLITSSDTFDTEEDPYSGNPIALKTGDDPDTVDATEPEADKIVAESVFGDEKKTNELPALEQAVMFDRQDVTTAETVFATSGSYEIVFERTGDAKFKPIASAKDNGVVKFFGRVDDGVGGTETGDKIEGYGPFQDIGSFVRLDEDVISGEENTQPAMALNVSVPDSPTAMVALQVIFYQTSGIEYIEGNDKCFADQDNTQGALTGSDADRAAVQAACTADEVKDVAAGNRGDAFVLYAESDEDAADDRRHLALVETGRFTGIFQGYLRLTDADGDGMDGDGRLNWGLETGSAAYNHALANADHTNPSTAVLGVGTGPVSITYKDTDGKNRRYDIEIDIDPPTIQIDSPTHDGRSDDEKPSFIGSFNDSDSGLAADSFQLDVDNSDDKGDANPIMMISSGVMGPTPLAGDTTGQVRRRLDYRGYADDTSETYGVIGSDIYMLEDTAGGGVGGSKTHKSLEADDFADGAPDGEFNGELEVDFDEFIPSATFDGFNNAVDFQAVVRDLAGNFGFSDSDGANPRFIDALGEAKDADRVKGPKKHNVLGVYSRHVVHIDEIDPVIQPSMSVTGFYGVNADKVPQRDRSAVMVVFDNSVNGNLIDNGTFTLEHEDESGIEIIDVDVEGKLVFLKLGEELASDATPTLRISEGREIEDLAGNVLGWQEKDAEAFEVNDGILPVFTLTLSGGSGTGVGSEGPSMLTNTAMDISIESDEDITGAPKVSVVCSNIGWTEGTGDDAKSKGLNDYINNRTGNKVDASAESGLLCGGAAQPSLFTPSSSLSRPGNNWVYAWRNSSLDDSPTRHMNDGELVVVVWGNDRSEYHDRNSTEAKPILNKNFGSETIKFVLDDTFNTPLVSAGGSVQPTADAKVKEPRPFVYLDFAGEPTTVSVTELKVDGVDVLADISNVGVNRFLYWPEALEFGEHTVEFDALDAANNNLDNQKTSFKFDVTARDPFVLDITAGWNAISFPADPVDPALEAVFTEDAIDRVVGWNPLSQTGPWSIATRIDGVWGTSANAFPLTDVQARYGYWVHSIAFVKQSVDLVGPINRETGGKPDPIGIATIPGWNFVGVIDQDGDQTEDHFGDVLQDSEDVDVTAKDYMPGFRQAYTWDAIANGYRVLPESGNMIIGKGIWVFFPDDTTIAP